MNVDDVNDDTVEKEVSRPSNDVHNDVMNDAIEVLRAPKQSSIKPFTLPLLSHKKMTKAKLDLQLRKFLEVLKKLLRFHSPTSYPKCLLTLSFQKRFYQTSPVIPYQGGRVRKC